MLIIWQTRWVLFYKWECVRTYQEHAGSLVPAQGHVSQFASHATSSLSIFSAAPELSPEFRPRCLGLWYFCIFLHEGAEQNVTNGSCSHLVNPMFQHCITPAPRALQTKCGYITISVLEDTFTNVKRTSNSLFHSFLTSNIIIAVNINRYL